MARTVLVAADNPIIRKMLCQMFELEDDYDLCAEAANGKQAVELAVRCRPDYSGFIDARDEWARCRAGTEAPHA
jgi:DNA-binding NarL/FixJ family response regulator